MKILVGYASSEGHTRKIARHVADRIADAGHAVELLSLADAGDIDLGRFDGAILGGSIHIGHYQKHLSAFAAAHHAPLNAMPTLLLSVSLAAAGHDAEDWRALNAILADLQEATEWRPGSVAQVAGAYKPSEYDVFRRFIMRRIVAARDPEGDPGVDRDYTDWPALDRLVEGWVTALS